MRQTANEAFGRWPGILQALGVDPKFLRDEHGPCPICGGKDRFRFDDQSNGSWFCNNCIRKGGPRPDGFTLLQKLNGWDFTHTANEVDRVLGIGSIPKEKPKPVQTDEQKAAAIRKMLESAGPCIPGTPAWAYLARRCGDPSGFCLDLRAHKGIRYTGTGETWPALLAILRRADGWGASVHRYYLTPDGMKAPVPDFRRCMPAPAPGIAGAAIRTSPILPRIGIAEGLETALCASKLYGLPVWSALSAPGVESFVPPPGVEEVVIFGDADASYTGQASAYALAKRLTLEKIKAEVVLPRGLGRDFADEFADLAAAS